jgi:hypothetical protein
MRVLPPWFSSVCQGLKSVARFPQFYSRIGFVHKFRPLNSGHVQDLLESRWTPTGVTLPEEQLLPAVIATLVRMTGGNFRLLTRLLPQIERVLIVKDLNLVSIAILKTARDSLVIGLRQITPNNYQS